MPTFKIESSFRQSETTSAFYVAAETADAAGAAYLASLNDGWREDYAVVSVVELDPQKTEGVVLVPLPAFLGTRDTAQRHLDIVGVPADVTRRRIVIDTTDVRAFAWSPCDELIAELDRRGATGVEVRGAGPYVQDRFRFVVDRRRLDEGFVTYA
ncbi:hypothetical protein [Frigoribacterium sp. SL97]|uniref:hypothetical protein n=1 Tax=Frigoribacterium sp. SL97 TaxID=2994664 RepID=UPI00226F97C5|nr:hypothetical protein [Frigoribacterium sp. SL97]WAC50330.1 hypothetical protein OVA02_10545 [Frigoribacterium sp. SL97]